VRAFDLSLRSTPRRRCRVRIGRGALDRLVEELAEGWPRGLFALVTDERVRALHAEPLAGRLRGRGLRAELLVLAAGETTKTWSAAGALVERLGAIGADRETVCVAVGGGVTSDVAGFVASVWHRGIPVIHVPTTLLAMVDASIGGKTGVNLAAGKNLVGTIHQPWGVYADPEVLGSLAPADYAAGLAEVVKLAAVADLGFFRWLESAARELIAREPDAVERAVVRSVQLKGRIVQRDERDAGPRAALNFGHTLAHAAEAVAGYRLSHGAAVSAGTCLEARIATRVTGFPERQARRIEDLLGGLGLPRRFPESIAAEALLAATRRDKKVRQGRVRYALPCSLGRMPAGDDVTVPVADEIVRGVLTQSLPTA